MVNLPNMITLSRIFLTLFSICFYENKLYMLLLIFYIGVSDFLDGFIARKLNCSSEFGAELDHMADKFVTFFMLLSLHLLGMTPLYFVVIIVFRDYLSIFLKNEAKKYKAKLAVSRSAKIKTGLLFFHFFFSYLILFAEEMAFFHLGLVIQKYAYLLHYAVQHIIM